MQNTPNQVRLVLSAFVAMLVLSALDQTILSTALPAIVKELHGQDRMSWVFSAYLMASTVAIPLYGRLADLHGAKPWLLVATGLFLAGSVTCGLASSMGQLIAARAVQGAGGGGLMTLTMLGVAALVPLQRRTALQGLLGASYGLAVMFGPLVGGVLVQHLSWHWAFFINLPVALAALPVIALAMPATPPRPRQSLDVLGVLLLGTALVTLLLGTRRGGGGAGAGADAGLWGQGTLLAMGALLSMAFLLAQRRTRHPMLPLTLFTRPAFSAVAFISTSTGAALFSAVVFLPTYFQTALGLTPTASAWHLLPLMAGVTLAAIGSGRLLRAHGPLRRTALVACGLMLLGLVSLVAALRWAPGQAALLSACVLPLGLGLGLLFPIVTAVAQRSAPPQHLGVATSTPIMLRTLGGALGVSALGAWVADRLSTGLVAMPAQALRPGVFAGVLASALQPVYAAVAGVCLLAVAAAWRLPSRVDTATDAA